MFAKWYKKYKKTAKKRWKVVTLSSFFFTLPLFTKLFVEQPLALPGSANKLRYRAFASRYKLYVVDSLLTEKMILGQRSFTKKYSTLKKGRRYKLFSLGFCLECQLYPKTNQSVKRIFLRFCGLKEPLGHYPKIYIYI